SFEISKAEQEEIHRINPDLVLLCGGTNGDNKEVIIANARRLCEIECNFSVICAGNKSASHELEDIFAESGKNCVITENVMPEFNQLNIE
ncbi:glutamate mutase L, partial [Streptococcus pyogenes]